MPDSVGRAAKAAPENALRDSIGRADAGRGERLSSLAALRRSLPPRPDSGGESNNHIHTCYSFSPYTPAAAALKARESGLEAAGSVDHDSIAAAAEMREACAILGIGCVTGCEIRVSFAQAAASNGAARGRSPFADRKINNPDSSGIAYMTIQGVPEWGRGRLDAFLAPIRACRATRTRSMTVAADSILRDSGARGIEFETDVRAHSRAAEGGGITERHLLAAVADRIIERCGRGPALPEGLAHLFGVTLAPRQAALLGDAANPYLAYDMLGVLKAGFLDRIFIQPDAIEAVDARDAVALARSIGAIPAYAYLGDVAESPTGDKKAEKFEDDFLEELFPELQAFGFPAVTYMPPRNTAAQLERVRTLCSRFGLMEISGVDINQPRQSFNCPELRRPEFRHLADSTWALAAHESLSTFDPSLGLLAPGGPLAGAGMAEKIEAYSRAGRSIDSADPDSAAAAAENLRKGRFLR